MEEMLKGEPTSESVIASISTPARVSANITESTPESTPVSVNAKTQLQQFSASLLHVQTNLTIEIPAHLPVVHIGKPNTVIPPDIDVSGFPDSDIVSRIHADIRTEGGFFYFEDTGSSNGTYINNLTLPAGNRHKLRAGDRICLGKGDKVSFIFQLS
jgi:pSer/pThr/pTyr-binding forkhead associated (FHA) protein